MKQKFSLLIGIIVVCFSCQKALIKPDPTSSPEQNFEIFWNDVYNGYPYLVEDNIDWKERYKAYRPLVTSSTSTDTLFEIFTEMLQGFSDGHLGVEFNGNSYGNEKIVPSLLQLVKENQSGTPLPSTDPGPIVYYMDHFRNISKGYVTPSEYRVVTASNGIDPFSRDTVCIYGTINNNNNIIYVNITTFLTDYSFSNLLQNEIFPKYPNAKGLILDLRWNEGGSIGTMMKAVSSFMPSTAAILPYAYAKEKVGPLPENFGEQQYYGIYPTPGNKFLKPVVVLTNRITISAAEHAAMAMREIRKRYNPKIKVVGDYTFGAVSFVVQRTLPNGIKYTLVNSKTWDVNQNLVEKTGVKPDEFYYITPAITRNKDEQIERAVEIINQDKF